jgi:hypothetical protein
MVTDPHTIASRLGIDETLVRRLQARGYLLTFQLDQAEVRERLFRAHTAFVLRRARAARRAIDETTLTEERGHLLSATRVARTSPASRRVLNTVLQLVGVPVRPHDARALDPIPDGHIGKSPPPATGFKGAATPGRLRNRLLRL